MCKDLAPSRIHVCAFTEFWVVASFTGLRTHVAEMMEKTCVQPVAMHLAQAASRRDLKRQSTVWNEYLCGDVPRVPLRERNVRNARR